PVARPGDEPRPGNRDDDADRNVEDEHRAPTPRFDEEPPEGRTQRDRKRTRRSPECDSLRNPRLRECSQDQRHRRGGEIGRPESLQDPGRDEDAGARRDCADRRSYREDAHSAEKDTPPPEAIGPSAGPEHPRGYDDRVTGKDPRQRSCADFGEITTNVAE